MILHLQNFIPIYRFSIFSRFDEIDHFISTRKGRVSNNQFHSLNLGNESSDADTNRQENFEIFSECMGIDLKCFCLLKQDHGSGIKIIEPEQPSGLNNLFEGYDAMITNVPNKCLVVRTADCVPLLLFDPRKKVIAAVHAGWRGTVKRISQKTVRTMVEKFNCDPSDIIVGIGPSISPDVYEVSDDVYRNFKDNNWDCETIFSPSNNQGKYRLDLWCANQLQLEEIGVASHNIEVSKLCTYSDSKLFFSARRDGIESGRLASGIMLR